MQPFKHNSNKFSLLCCKLLDSLNENVLHQRGLDKCFQDRLMLVSSFSYQCQNVTKGTLPQTTMSRFLLLQLTIVSSNLSKEVKYVSMYDRRPGDVPRTFHHLVLGTFPNWVPQASRGRPHLELLHICFSSNSYRCVKQELLHLKKAFFFKLSFLLVP